MIFSIPKRLSASTLARVRSGTVSAAFFLWCSAACAQSIPAGYVATREGDIIVMRPSAAADPDVTIRVYPPIAGDADLRSVVRRWSESHPLVGVDPAAVHLQNQTMHGVSVLERVWKNGGVMRQEYILMPSAGPGNYQPVIVRWPSQPGDLMQKHANAMAFVVALIVGGHFQPNLPVKGSPAVGAAPIEPVGTRTAGERPAAPNLATQTQRQANSEQLVRWTEEIETVGFMNQGQMGVYGSFTFLPKPVALFRGGDVLLHIDVLRRVTSIEADRAAHPMDWSRWRRTAGGIELLKDNKWKKLDYAKTMDRLPTGFVLSGKFENLSGGGGYSVGEGGTALVAQTFYTFRPDGTFSTNRLASVLSRDSYYATFNTHSPVVEGRYRIDGYLLRLEPTSGPPETHVVATYPTDPSSLWIDWLNYTRAQ